MKFKWQISVLLLLVAVLSFYLGTVATGNIQAQSSQETRKKDAQGRFFPTPSAGPAQKSSWGVVGDIALRVRDVKPGSPAESLGLKAGDFIVEVDGKQFYSVTDVRELLAEKNPGDEVKVQYLKLNKDACRQEIKVGAVKMAPLNR